MRFEGGAKEALAGTETDDMTAALGVRLLQDVSVCEALGAFSVLFQEGTLLPATASVKVSYSPATGANNSISFFEGQRPLAAALYKSGKPTKEEVARILDISVVLNEFGHFSAHAIPTDGASQFLVFCATIDVPRTTASPAEGDGVVVRIVEKPDAFARAAALDQDADAESADVLGAFVGFTVDGEVLECVFEPKGALPASKLIEPGFLDDDRRVGLLSIDPIDLNEDEREELDSTSTLTLIDDDRDNAICFHVPDGVERLKLTVLRGGELRLEALQGGEFVALEGIIGFIEFKSGSEGPPSDDHHESEPEIAETELAPEPEPEPEQQLNELLLPLTEERGVSRLFVSHHSNADGKFATWLVGQLEERGVQCWVAPRDIRAGANWHRSITRAIAECEAMVVVVSSASLESEFVQGEVHRALDAKKRVVPLILEAGLDYTNIDVRLETKQRIDWWKVGDAGLRLLSTSL